MCGFTAEKKKKEGDALSLARKMRDLVPDSVKDKTNKQTNKQTNKRHGGEKRDSLFFFFFFYRRDNAEPNKWSDRREQRREEQRGRHAFLKHLFTLTRVTSASFLRLYI